MSNSLKPWSDDYCGPRQEHRCEQAAPLYFTHSIFIDSSWNVGSMCIAHVACSLFAHATLLHTHASTHNWIKSLGWEMREKDMPASTDALQSVSGGSFAPSFEISGGFVRCCLSMFGTQTHCHFGSFYLSQALE